MGEQGKQEELDRQSFLNYLPTSPPPHLPHPSLNFADWASWQRQPLAQQLLAEDPRRQLISTDAIRSQLFGDEAIQGPWLLFIWRCSANFKAVV